MTCPQCAFENPPAMAFCGRCGGRLAGRFGDEGMILRLGAQREQARPWFHLRPPVAA